jgi:3-hydroxyisobutyrate dehydrogenase-like beta-hydroxyacid dehydrogenase
MRIGIVGLGYVGLPLAVAFCEAGQVERLVGGSALPVRFRGATRGIEAPNLVRL